MNIIYFTDDRNSYWDEEEESEYWFCPNCGIEYDEIDYEYQICHYCGYDAERETFSEYYI